ncbi:MAG TPA: hypothetical protein VF026_22075 [Ktedonobacteraceae bacterium]
MGQLAVSKEQLREITIHLNGIQDLFADPEPGSDSYVSGMDYLYGEINTYSLREKFREKLKVRIELPQEQITEGLLERTRQKMKLYCQFKIEENQKTLIALRHQGIASLWVGLIVLAICLVLAGIFTLVAQVGTKNISLALLAILAEGFLIAGWVAMWHPAELLLYDWWPFRRDIRIYRHIAEADIALRAVGAEVASGSM